MYEQLLASLDDLRSRWRLRRVIEGLGVAIAVAAGVLTAGAICDQWLDPAMTGRVALAVCFWTIVVAGLWRWVVTPVRIQHCDDFFASLIEQRVPTLGNRFINAVQLGREHPSGRHRLVERIVADAIEIIDQVDPRQAVSGDGARRRLVASGAVIIAAMVVLVLLGPAARTSLARILLPFAEIAPHTRTQLVPSFGPSVTVREGEPLKIEVETRGHVPERADLAWIDGDRRRSVRMARSGSAFGHAFAAVSSPFRFSVSAGDAKTDWVMVAVTPRPRVTSMSVTYTYPAYAHLAARTIDEFDGHLHGLAGSQARLTVRVNRDLEALSIQGIDPVAPFKPEGDGRSWTGSIALEHSATWRIELRETDYRAVAPETFTLSVEQDQVPGVRFTDPGRDLQIGPEQTARFGIGARDDLGLAAVRLVGQVHAAGAQASGSPVTLAQWPFEAGSARRRVDLAWQKPVAELGLGDGARLEYWAEAVDHNDRSGPGLARTRRFNLVVVGAEQSRMLEARRLSDYARVVSELIRLQRENRAETAALMAGEPLVARQSVIRRHTMRLADLMERNRFPAESIIATLRELAAGPMADALGGLERYRDARGETGRDHANGTLPVQDGIVESLEQILMRLNRDQRVRALLRKIRKQDPVAHRKISTRLERLAEDLDAFLVEVKEIEEKYEKIAKRRVEDLEGEDLKILEEAEHRVDKWKKWAKDTVDDIAKLPEGFVNDTHLKDDLNTIFEEIEKQQRARTTEIATPVEEGVKALAQTVAEDVEIWMPHAGDSVRWVMEQPPEGKFEVPPYTLPESLQDMVGELIEDITEFDEAADDITSTWGGNMAVGWDVMDGPISVFSAQGKTGNQLPNNSEITGRSGGGRRGKSSGQMVGSESRALEGRPTPARVTKEPYEAGAVSASRQLDPRGATGGGKKTGGGARGLQGGTPPDVVKHMQRLTRRQKVLQEKLQQLAREFQVAGRSSWRLDRSLELMEAAGQDMQDRRYRDGARRRRVALSDLRALQGEVDEAVSMSLEKARDVPPELRQQITAGAQQPLPDGYEHLVGAYYRMLSEVGEEGPSGP